MYKKSTIDKISKWLEFPFLGAPEPKSIILNFSDEEKPHGCARACSYCNWKTNPLAQQRIYPEFKKLDEYTNDCTGFMTISGGGDPLYKYEKNKEDLHKLINYLYDKKFFVRVITREIQNFLELRKTYPLILGSFSIDSLKEIPIIRDKGITEDDEFVEFSMVLDEEKVKEISKTRCSCLPERMVIREPLDTGYKLPLGWRTMVQRMRRDIEFSTEKLCYEAWYLVGDRIMQGYDIFK